MQQTKSAIRILRNENFTTYVSSLKNTDQSIWKPTKSRKKPRLHIPPIRKNTTPLGPWARSDEERTKLFASHLAEVYTPHSNTPDPEVENILASHDKSHTRIRACNASELNQIIKKLCASKAPGPDQITARMIQELPSSGQQTLLQLYNAMLRLEYWPATL